MLVALVGKKHTTISFEDMAATIGNKTARDCADRYSVIKELADRSDYYIPRWTPVWTRAEIETLSHLISQKMPGTPRDLKKTAAMLISMPGRSPTAVYRHVLRIQAERRNGVISTLGINVDPAEQSLFENSNIQSAPLRQPDLIDRNGSSADPVMLQELDLINHNGFSLGPGLLQQPHLVDRDGFSVNNTLLQQPDSGDGDDFSVDPELWQLSDLIDVNDFSTDFTPLQQPNLTDTNDSLVNPAFQNGSDWSDEDTSNLLLRLCRQPLGTWSEIAQEFPGRSERDCELEFRRVCNLESD